jgi:hypothetical protein
MLRVLRDAFLFGLFGGGDGTAWVLCADADTKEEAVGARMHMCVAN